MLQFPIFADSLTRPEHLIYILELYPNQQFASQDLKQIKNQELHPIFVTDSSIKAHVPVLMEALRQCLQQSQNELNFDTPVGNWVYEMAKRLLFSIQQNRLGMSRTPALNVFIGQMRWYDSHKGPLPG